jgi:hypothetical protein
MRNALPVDSCAARVPWSAWLQWLWLDVVAADALADPPRLTTSGQSGYLWDRIVDTETARNAPLVDARGAPACRGRVANCQCMGRWRHQLARLGGRLAG